MPQVYFNLPAEDLAVVDHLAELRGTSRSEVLRELVQEALTGRRPDAVSSETPRLYLIRDIDAWLRTILTGQPTDPDREYVLRVHPTTQLAITEVAARQMGVTTLLRSTDQVGMLRSRYGRVEVVIEPDLTPGEWFLYEAVAGGRLLNDGRLGYPPASRATEHGH